MSNVFFNHDYEASCIEEFFNKSALEFSYRMYGDCYSSRTFSLSVENEILDEKYFRGLSWFMLLVNISTEDAALIGHEDTYSVEQRILKLLEDICSGALHSNTQGNLWYGLYAGTDNYYARDENTAYFCRCDIETLSNKPPILGFNEKESDELVNTLLSQRISNKDVRWGYKLLMSIGQLYIEDTNINDLYIESHSKYLSINFGEAAFINTTGTVVLNTDQPNYRKIIHGNLKLEHSELNVVDLNASTALGLCRFELSLLPTAPILRRCASYYQEPDDASHIKLVTRGTIYKIEKLEWMASHGWLSQAQTEESLLERNRLLQELKSRANRHITGGIIVCKDKETFERFIGLKCKMLKNIYIMNVKLSTDAGIDDDRINSHGFQITASTINYIDSVGLLSLTRNGIEDKGSLPYLDSLSVDASVAPRGISGELDSTDSSKYYFLQIHDAESDNMNLVSRLSYFLKYFDYVWYQSGPQCKTVAGSYAMQNGCQHMIGN